MVCGECNGSGSCPGWRARLLGASVSSHPVTAMRRITIIRPDDWHLHLRDDDHMRAVLRDTALRFARAIVMPNLRPPVTTTAAAIEYRDRILAALPTGAAFQPLMTLYLT